MSTTCFSLIQLVPVLTRIIVRSILLINLPKLIKIDQLISINFLVIYQKDHKTAEFNSGLLQYWR